MVYLSADKSRVEVVTWARCRVTTLNKANVPTTTLLYQISSQATSGRWPLLVEQHYPIRILVTCA